MAPGMSGANARICQRKCKQTMPENELEAGGYGPEVLLDLNEIMQAFGVSEWNSWGPVEAPQSNQLSLLVEIQGQRYILKERPEGLVKENTGHRYDFRRFLQRAGIPIPPLWLTPQGESA